MVASTSLPLLASRASQEQWLSRDACSCGTAAAPRREGRPARAGLPDHRWGLSDFALLRSEAGALSDLLASNPAAGLLSVADLRRGRVLLADEVPADVVVDDLGRVGAGQLRRVR